jgi:hypothetical protein
VVCIHIHIIIVLLIIQKVTKVLFCLCKFHRNCKQLACIYVKFWMSWLEETGGADGSCVRDGGGGGGVSWGR